MNTNTFLMLAFILGMSANEAAEFEAALVQELAEFEAAPVTLSSEDEVLTDKAWEEYDFLSQELDARYYGIKASRKRSLLVISKFDKRASRKRRYSY